MTPSPGQRRAGLSLLEVLVAIFVMGVGVISLLVLFPLGLQNVKWALDNEQVARAAHSGQAMSEMSHVRVQEDVNNHPVVSIATQSLRNDDQFRPETGNQDSPWWLLQVPPGPTQVAARLGGNRQFFLHFNLTPGTAPSSFTFATSLLPAGSVVLPGLPTPNTRVAFPPVFVDPFIAGNANFVDPVLNLAFPGHQVPFHVGAVSLASSPRSPFASHPLPPTVVGNVNFRPPVSLGLPRFPMSQYTYDQGMVAMRLESEMSMRDELVFGTNGRPALGPSTTVYPNNRRFSWAYLCRWPDVNKTEVCDVSVAAFNSRPISMGALTNFPPGETTYISSVLASQAAGLDTGSPAIPPLAPTPPLGRMFRKGFSTAVISLGTGVQPVSFKVGDWLLDNTFILPEFDQTNPGEVAPFLDEYNPQVRYRFASNNELRPGLVGGHFYKILDISNVQAAGGEFFQVITLDRPAKSDGFVATVFSGLADVIQKGVGRMPSR